METPVIRTIGHSTRPVDVRIEMLKARGVTLLIDVGAIPKSRYKPQYNREALKPWLRGAGIAYEHIKLSEDCGILQRLAEHGLAQRIQS